MSAKFVSGRTVINLGYYVGKNVEELADSEINANIQNLPVYG